MLAFCLHDHCHNCYGLSLSVNPHPLKCFLVQFALLWCLFTAIGKGSRHTGSLLPVCCYCFQYKKPIQTLVYSMYSVLCIVEETGKRLRVIDFYKPFSVVRVGQYHHLHLPVYHSGALGFYPALERIMVFGPLTNSLLCLWPLVLSSCHGLSL